MSISFWQKLLVEKLGYTVKFQKAVQSRNAVSSACPRVKNEVRHKKVAE